MGTSPDEPLIDFGWKPRVVREAPMLPINASCGGGGGGGGGARRFGLTPEPLLLGSPLLACEL